jgi:hypothetical protein
MGESIAEFGRSGKWLSFFTILPVFYAFSVSAMERTK